jgi:hypothetical protein
MKGVLRARTDKFFDVEMPQKARQERALGFLETPKGFLEMPFCRLKGR